MDDKKIEKAIEDLRNLKLSEYPINDIYKLISDLGEFGTIIVNYHPGKVIMRARPMNERNDLRKFLIYHINHKNIIQPIRGQVRLTKQCSMVAPFLIKKKTMIK